MRNAYRLSVGKTQVLKRSTKRHSVPNNKKRVFLDRLRKLVPLRVLQDDSVPCSQSVSQVDVSGPVSWA